MLNAASVVISIDNIVTDRAIRNGQCAVVPDTATEAPHPSWPVGGARRVGANDGSVDCDRAVFIEYATAVPAGAVAADYAGLDRYHADAVIDAATATEQARAADGVAADDAVDQG